MTAPESEQADRQPFPTLVSVIIPVRNAAAVLPGQLKALANQNYDGAWEAVVVDNDSHDATADVALAWKSKMPKLRVTIARRRGVSHARNVGATAARGDVLLFCDAVDIATPSWLRAMASAARTTDIVGGYLGLDTLNSPRARSYHDRNPRDRLPIAFEFLPYAVGACFGVRTDVFTALDGFNEVCRLWRRRHRILLARPVRLLLSGVRPGSRDAVPPARPAVAPGPPVLLLRLGATRGCSATSTHTASPGNTLEAVEHWQWVVRHLPAPGLTRPSRTVDLRVRVAPGRLVAASGIEPGAPDGSARMPAQSNYNRSRALQTRCWSFILHPRLHPVMADCQQMVRRNYRRRLRKSMSSDTRGKGYDCGKTI